jgi:nitroreductase
VQNNKENMDFLQLAKKRFSARQYLDKKVSKDDLNYILEAGRIAPSANNFQPWKWIVIQEEDNLRRVYQLYHREWFKTAPVVLLILADHQQAWERPEDGKNHAIIDASIVADHITLAATQRGLATCWVCNFYVKKTIEYFRLPEHLEPVAFLTLGYPVQEADETRHYRKRKKLEEIVFFEKLS